MMARRLKPALVSLLTASLSVASAQPPDEPRRSGLDFMSPALQALQRDDSQNPAMLWVQDGAALDRKSVV